MSVLGWWSPGAGGGAWAQEQEHKRGGCLPQSLLPVTLVVVSDPWTALPFVVHGSFI